MYCHKINALSHLPVQDLEELFIIQVDHGAPANSCKGSGLIDGHGPHGYRAVSKHHLPDVNNIVRKGKVHDRVGLCAQRSRELLTLLLNGGTERAGAYVGIDLCGYSFSNYHCTAPGPVTENHGLAGENILLQLIDSNIFFFCHPEQFIRRVASPKFLKQCHFHCVSSGIIQNKKAARLRGGICNFSMCKHRFPALALSSSGH